MLVLILMPFITSNVGTFTENKVVYSPATSGGGNVTNFTDLDDTPSSYGGNGGLCVKVTGGEDGLEFGACGSGSGDITDVQGDDKYIWNGSNSGAVRLEFNETLLNKTIDLRDDDTTIPDTIWAINETNFYNDSGTLELNFTFLDLIYVRISNIVSLVGNWTADKGNYYLKTDVDTNITDANTTLTGYIDAQDENYNNTMTAYVDAQGGLSEESDPYWLGNLTAYNESWSNNTFIPDTNCTVDGSCPDIVYELELSYTVDTNASTACSNAEVLLGNGTCFPSSAFSSGSVNENQTFNPLIGFTSNSYNGNITNGSEIGYNAANNICGIEFPGSHFCLEVEMMKYNYVNRSITGQYWIVKGAPGYTANANDCEGWTKTSGEIGPFWDFNENVGVGAGKLTPCSSELKLACCGP